MEQLHKKPSFFKLLSNPCVIHYTTEKFTEQSAHNYTYRIKVERQLAFKGTGTAILHMNSCHPKIGRKWHRTDSYAIENRVKHMLEGGIPVNWGSVTFGQRQHGSPDSSPDRCR